mmetsp:Transcript_4634/g.11904  ORF Transcript_4634/g.11904 Transcript_4634/m.11904 type:complete len:213 (+) Transcript_4634:1128-1766(+)
MFVDSLNPSISTSSWLRVFSRSSLPPPNDPCFDRARPTASISSMKMMHGEALRASVNRSRTRAGPTPTNISRNSDPEIVKNGTWASPAVAFARSVLPVPGGPCRTAPLGIFAPSAWYISGFFKKLTNSMISTLASSQPATSLKLVLISVSGPIFLAVLLPKPMGPPRPPAPPMPPIDDIDDANRWVIQMSTPTISNVGANLRSSFAADVSEM